MFINLHTHSMYSSLDGMMTPKEIVAECKKQGVPGFAVTDHGTLGGTFDLFKEAEKEGLKFIPGLEAYFAEDAKIKSKNYHLVLLPLTKKGYDNIVKLNYLGYEHFYRKPRIDFDMLLKHSEDIVVTSACIAGIVNNHAMQGDSAKAEEYADRFRQIFGDRFYLEVQPDELIGPDQTKCNLAVMSLAKKMNIPIVCTTDAHYVSKSQREMHHLFISIQFKKPLNRYDDYGFECSHFMNEKEISKYFPHSYIKNTQRIFEMCEKIEFKKENHLPHYDIKNEEIYEKFLKFTKTSNKVYNKLAKFCKNDEDRFLIFKSLRGLKNKKKVSVKYIQRLISELHVIITKGLSGYILLVNGITDWASTQKILKGPARGSAAGSLVCYALSITDIDPLQYNLLFERFINKERQELADIDLDFDFTKRDLIKNVYLPHKYGADNVAAIATYGKIKGRAAIKDVCRSLQSWGSETFTVANKVTAMMQGESIKASKELSEEFAAFLEQNKEVEEKSLQLEGLIRQAGVHAAGVVIADKPLLQVAPLKKVDGVVVVEYDKNMAEEIGLLKVDLLALKTLTVMDSTARLIKKRHGVSIDFKTLNKDDEKTFELLRKGDTAGVFQLESDGMKKFLADTDVRSVPDIAAVLALFRPGPLTSGEAGQYAKYKQLGTPKLSGNKIVDNILKETYGFLIYEEQMLLIAHELAKFSIAKADNFRKGAKKKKVEIIESMREDFIVGSSDSMSKQEANELFDKMVAFAGYAFNKSHAVSYAHLSYYTAYLKAHYLAEFMCASLQYTTLDDKLDILKRDCRKHGVKLVAPSVNMSDSDSFTIVGNDILYSLKAIKRIGDKFIPVIRNNRPFSSIEEFIEKAKPNSAQLAALTKAGCMDEFGISRKYLYNVTRDKKLWNKIRKGKVKLEPTESDWTLWEKMQNEADVLGEYISGSLVDICEDLFSPPSLNIPLLKDYYKYAGSNIRIIGEFVIYKIIGQYAIKKGKNKGSLMGILEGVDKENEIVEIVAWPDIFEKISKLTYPFFLKCIGIVKIRNAGLSRFQFDIKTIKEVNELND